MVCAPGLYGYARPQRHRRTDIKTIVQVIVAALTALLTSLGVVSCI